MNKQIQINKIHKSIPVKVHAQACSNNCEEKIWAGKKAKDRWEGGCWSTIALTARGAWW